ncbi:vWA domain-containing protein [Sediminispirochaeta bajacaliforniensis]|uniref:vWA domain-containing protein n=1 Tax=Sediminispirochaeta bajacaliforniensis TaxID=148 RepID=UPI00036EC1A0|nr:vWA domain-containing protein [Sediminispirochaeta bajacaliforniensis]
MKKRSDGRRRVLLPVAIFLLFSFSGSGALTAQSVDAVVLIDTSESMFSYFDATRDYLIHRILTEELKIGDSFHLLSFSDRPEYEISRKLKGVDEIKDVIARLMLLQPLGHYTDLVAACKELYDYTSDLPLETQKEIFILTDGIHDPPPGSPYPVSSRNGEDVSDIAASMRRNGWKVHIIQFPIVASDASMQSDLSGDIALASDDDNIALSPENTSSDERLSIRPEATQEEAVATGSDSGTDRTDQGQEPEPGNNLLPTISDKLGIEAVPYSPEDEGFAYRATGQLEIVFPRTLGKIGEEFVLPLDIRNHLEGPAAVKINDLLINGTRSLEKPVSLGLNPGDKRRVKLNLSLPSSVPEGDGTIDVELRLGDAGRAFPRSSTISVRVVRGEGIVGRGTPFRMILFFLVVIVVLVPVILFIRRTSGNKEDNKEGRVDKEIHSETEERERVSSVSPNIPKIEKHTAALPAFRNTPVSLDLPQSRQTEGMQEAVDSLQAYQRQERPLPEFYRTTTTVETKIPPKLRSTGTVSLSASARHDSGLYTMKEIVSARAQGKIAVEMVVRDQNRLIGRRNIKWMKEGETLKVGGAASSPFIIFLYPVPSSIGTLIRQGEQFFFTPESSDRFPGFGSGDMLKSECIDMPITFAVNDEISIEFRFHRWISPLESLNRMLHMIDEPGLPK